MNPTNLGIYWRVWLLSAKLSLSRALATRTASFTFFLGKLFRFGSFIYFIFILGGQLTAISGYDYQHLLIFFLVFNLFDIIGQLFFRGIYWFRQQVISGEFDFRLVKPLNPLFQALTRETDLLDLPLLVIVLIALGLEISHLPHVAPVLVLVTALISLVCITAIHVLVAALGLLTTEVDHTMWVYRDLSMTARFPLDIYPPAVRGVLTYVVPIGLIFTFPAKALTGLLPAHTLLIGSLFSVGFFILAYRFWLFALTKYSSASS